VNEVERKIILATHGNFAAGIQTSLALICGETKNVECVCAYTEQSFDLAKTVAQVLTDNKQKELIVITDIFGGSVNNEFFNYVGTQPMYLISGLNLALLIELYTQLEVADSLEALVERAVASGRESLCYCNPLAAKETLEEEF